MLRRVGLIAGCFALAALLTAQRFPAVNSTLPGALTPATGAGVTLDQPGVLSHQVYRVTMTFAAFSAAALTADHLIATLPARTRLCGLYAQVTQVFTGGLTSAATLTVGSSVGGTQYFLASDVRTAVRVIGLAAGDLGTSLATTVQGCAPPTFAGTTPVGARITTVGANTNALTQGSVTFFLVTEVLP